MIKRRGTVALARRLVEVALWAKVQFSFFLLILYDTRSPPTLAYILSLLIHTWKKFETH